MFFDVNNTLQACCLAVIGWGFAAVVASLFVGAVVELRERKGK